MPLIDERGRVFGKVNLIDGLVGLVVLLLIPLAYGAYVLFRTPDPTITSVEPSVVTEGETIALELSGENLRPYLRASIGTTQSLGFLVQSPTEGAIKLPALAAGTYDVVLYDEVLEVARMRSALTVTAKVPPPPPLLPRVDLQLIGVFKGLRPQEVRSIRVGRAFFESPEGGATATVLAVKESEPATQRMRVGGKTLTLPVLSGEVQVPAIVRVSCRVAGEECPVFGTVLAPDARIAMPLSSAPPRKVQFVIHEVRDGETPVTFNTVARPVATIRVRFLVQPGLETVVRVGDLDLGDALSSARADRALLVAVDPERESMFASAGRSGYGIERYAVTAFMATVRVPLVQQPLGWRYKDVRVKAGAPFSFETSSYVMEGWIIEAQLPSNIEQIFSDTERIVR